MHLKSIELSGFKSFAKKSALEFSSPIAGIVGPNGSGKSNAAEAFRFVLGEQSMKAMRGKRGPDLIWTGNDRAPRANRARVAVVFDNRKRLLDIDFDEVVVERLVHRDGANEYAINGSKVRLKDVAALLASANIGASGHHIISQGEADRILGATEKERREMIEEALGLKTYQFKKLESEKKLEKTAENMKEVKSLRREIAPHLTFLERQMQKLERSRELKQTLQQTYEVYIAHERAYVRTESMRLAKERQQPEQQLKEVVVALAQEEKHEVEEKERADELQVVDERIRAVAIERGKLEHARGRVEGQLALVQDVHTKKEEEGTTVPLSKLESFFTELTESIQSVSGVKEALEEITKKSKEFLQQFRSDKLHDTTDHELARSLKGELEEVEEALAALESEESALAVQRADILGAIEKRQAAEREAQKHYFELKEKKGTLERALERIAQDEKALAGTREQLKHREERAQDIGVELGVTQVQDPRSRTDQQDALREIERIEARIEESGFVDEDTVREYEETKKRDEFLERELADLETSKKTLLDIIENLENELAERFNEGLEKINSEFKKFFAMLFDGGDAELELVKKTKRNDDGEEEVDEEAKEGIEIRVQLPRKKVTTLDVLSGGERALTSIALIFAMSQVNPPPFIILDETDAALDEANSRKYADMVRALSEHSQLILITHNRQTMEAAGELYGVTMGNDGISKLLSVKFDDAVQVAK